METTREEAVKIAIELSNKVSDGKSITDDVYDLMKQIKEETWDKARKYYFKTLGH